MGQQPKTDIDVEDLRTESEYCAYKKVLYQFFVWGPLKILNDIVLILNAII